MNFGRGTRDVHCCSGRLKASKHTHSSGVLQRYRRPECHAQGVIRAMLARDGSQWLLYAGRNFSNAIIFFVDFQDVATCYGLRRTPVTSEPRIRLRLVAVARRQKLFTGGLILVVDFQEAAGTVSSGISSLGADKCFVLVHVADGSLQILPTPTRCGASSIGLRRVSGVCGCSCPAQE